MSKQPYREPSIHITRTKFREILQDELQPRYRAAEIDILVNEVFKRARIHSLTTRGILATTQKNRKVASKLVQSTLEDARLFSKTLLWVRRQAHHRGVVQIKEDSRDWLLIKQITELALAFTSDFNLSKDEGFKIYIQIALTRLKMFSLQRFPSLHEVICAQYEAKDKITKDPNSKTTQEACSYYTSIILKKTGEAPEYEKMPEKYQYFIDIAQFCKNSGVTLKHYIDAQFDAFNWASAVPELTQMVGDKAQERLAKYMYKNDLKFKFAPKLDLSKILEKNAVRGKQ